MLYKKKNNETHGFDFHLDTTLLYGRLILLLLVFMIREPEAKSMLENALGNILPFAGEGLAAISPHSILTIVEVIGLVLMIRQL